jgi:hypothetical protein
MPHKSLLRSYTLLHCFFIVQIEWHIGRMDRSKVILGGSARKAECYYQTKDMKMSLPTWMGAIFIRWLSKISFSVKIKLSYN